MPRYNVFATLTVRCRFIVNANNEAEAEGKVRDMYEDDPSSALDNADDDTFEIDVIGRSPMTEVINAPVA